jgi:hypothetical protein
MTKKKKDVVVERNIEVPTSDGTGMMGLFFALVALGWLAIGACSAPAKKKVVIRPYVAEGICQRMNLGCFEKAREKFADDQLAIKCKTVKEKTPTYKYTSGMNLAVAGYETTTREDCPVLSWDAYKANCDDEVTFCAEYFKNLLNEVPLEE